MLHTLEGSKRAVFCQPEPPDLARSLATRELDHILAAVFGLWDEVISEERLFSKTQASLPLKGGPKKAEPRPPIAEPKKVADKDE